MANASDMRVAIVGGGFSGSIAFVNLVREAQARIVIDWFEPYELGEGVAYGTQEAEHLLNVRAERMGALSQQPLHFFQWLGSPQGIEARNKVWPGQPIRADSYAPRLVYAAYIKYLIDQALVSAKRKAITVNLWRERVRDIVTDDAKNLLLTSDREKIKADAVILATGHLPAQPPVFISEEAVHSGYYVRDFWNVKERAVIRSALKRQGSDKEILLLGTGLTAVDVIQSLRATGFNGRITGISRHGLLPNVQFHGAPYPAWDWVRDPRQAPSTALGISTKLRDEVDHAQVGGHSWHAVVESLRHVTPALWAGLDHRERKKFWNRLATFWSVHRHRMSPEVGHDIQEALDTGKLRVMAGRINSIDLDGVDLRVRVEGNDQDNLKPYFIINCMGPRFDVSQADDGLFQNLLQKGLIEPHPDGGVVLGRNGAAAGAARGRLFPLGSLCIGELLECTAVPEIREQAHAVARHVLSLGTVPDFESN